VDEPRSARSSTSLQSSRIGSCPGLAAAILDRLLHRAHVLNIKGRSYRLRDLEDALKLSHA